MMWAAGSVSPFLHILQETLPPCSRHANESPGEVVNTSQSPRAQIQPEKHTQRLIALVAALTGEEVTPGVNPTLFVRKEPPQEDLAGLRVSVRALT